MYLKSDSQQLVRVVYVWCRVCVVYVDIVVGGGVVEDGALRHLLCSINWHDVMVCLYENKKNGE